MTLTPDHPAPLAEHRMNPITFSIIRHRLFRIVDEAVITLKNVSGSAITNEGHDLMVSLYRADGSLLMGGVGFLHHLTSAAEACKAIIRRFEGSIQPGDIYLLNDPYTAALHTSDVYLVAPIHHEGELVAWSACFVHVYDIGAKNPGGFCPDADSIYIEGFSSPGIRLVTAGELNQDVFDTLMNMVRSPEMVSLDLSSMIACNNVARERFLALTDKYGRETVDEACSYLIDLSEQRLRERLRELPDGQWQSRQYLNVADEVSTAVLTMTKEDDSLHFDFTGSSPQSPHSINCTRWASLGGLFAPLFPLLCYDITWNEGVIRPIRMTAPPGTIVNCERPAPVSVATVGAIQSVNNAACSTIGKMLAASPTYEHEATAVWHANHFAIFKFGRNQHDRESIGILTETFAGAGGARTFADGVDVGGEIPNPIARMANVETIENLFPILYEYRRLQTDSGGPGFHRGGAGMEMAITPHDAPDGGIDYVISGKGSRFPMSEGLAGGYPGAPNSYRWHHAEDGSAVNVEWGVYPLRGSDSLEVRWNGGGGVGDPILRDPELLREDVAYGLVSTDAAAAVYGVVFADDGSVDEAATTSRRAAMRAERQPANGVVPADKPVNLRYDGGACCGACGHVLTADPRTPWKAGLVPLERRMSDVSCAYTTSDEVVLREWACPHCGVLLDTETTRASDPPLLDIVTPS
ncbi:MAG: hydantoinase B/oxoprolinase family protein [Actinomycetota bacterium]